MQICRAMFTQEAPSFEGRHHRIEGALNFPRPARPGGPPILIGGSGERRTIPLLARHADACNFFGDVATIRHKLDVLDRCCEEIGRDPGEITKTRLGAVVIAPTSAEAERKLRHVIEIRNLDPERVRTFITGDPDSVAEQVDAFMEAGLDGMLISLPDAHNLETVELAARTLAERLGSATHRSRI